MKPEDIRFLLLTDGKVAFGEVTEKEINGKSYYEVRGALFLRTSSEGERYWEGDGKVHNAMQVRNSMQPFSPVGKFVQTSRIPANKVQMEILDMPPLVANMLVSVFRTEEQNAKTRDKMLSMPIAARSNMSPEQAISIVAQHINKRGKLPNTGRASANVDNMGTIIGNLETKGTSPYRKEVVTDGQ